MRTARSSSHPGGSPPTTPPRGRHPPPEQTLPGSRHPLGSRHPRSRHPPEQTPPAPPVNRITDACKNITLPNFVAGGNNSTLFGTKQWTEIIYPKWVTEEKTKELSKSYYRIQSFQMVPLHWESIIQDWVSHFNHDAKLNLGMRHSNTICMSQIIETNNWMSMCRETKMKGRGGEKTFKPSTLLRLPCP